MSRGIDRETNNLEPAQQALDVMADLHGTTVATKLLPNGSVAAQVGPDMCILTPGTVIQQTPEGLKIVFPSQR